VHIKSLQITGFKSFLEKTLFKFQPGITGIVGPNGCGKSNVVDAMRWAMGEQSPRQLRGKGMQDIIFGGSEEALPVGMAEVSLVFDTSDGSAPGMFSDFPEVEITRRLYRTGESEYLINKTVCRLRDVQDFFRDTGIGTHGYTIVEQGQIAQIVSARPDERRGLIEEAAGISKYKARRHEAELKLKATSQNLLRVDDILGEIRRQKNYLERQAKKAIRFKRLQAIERTLGLSIAAEEYRELSAKLASGRSGLEQMQAEALSLETRAAEREVATELLRVELAEAERILAERNEALYALRARIKELEGRIEFEKRDRVSLLEGNEARHVEIAGLREQVLVGEQEVRELVAELEAVERDLGREQQLVEAAEGEAKLALEGVRELESARNGVNKVLVERLTFIAGSENRASGLEERRRSLCDRLDALLAVAEGHREETASVEERIQVLEARFLDLNNERDRLNAALQPSQQVCQQMADVVRAAVENLQADRSRRDARAARLQSLRDLLARGEDVGSAARHLLQRGEEGKQVFGIRALVRDVIEAESRVEHAVEAVLAERVDALILSGEGNPLAAIQALRSAEAGRGVFVIETALSEASLMAATAERGELPGVPLRQLVRPKEGFERTADVLLRDVRFVEDLGAVLDHYRGKVIPVMFVSAQGDVLTPDGIVKGGGDDVGAGMLARVRELRELEDEVCALDSALGASEEAFRAAEAQRASAQQDLENLRQAHHAAALEAASCERDLVQARERRRALSLSEERRTLESAELERERERLDEEIARVGRQIQDSRLDQVRFEAELSQLESRIQEASSLATACRERVTQCKVDCAGRVERRDRLRSSRDRSQAALAERGQWIVRREQEIRDAEARALALQRSLSEAERCVNELLGEEQRAGVGQEAQRADFERRSQELRDLEKETRELRSVRSALGDSIQSETLKVQEIEFRAQHLIESVRDKWSVALETWQPSTLETEALIEEAEESSGDGAGAWPGESAVAVSVAGVEDLLALPFDERQERLKEVRRKLDSLGEVNVAAIEEHEELGERLRFLTEQKEDLERTIESLREAIARINRKSRKQFREAFEAVNKRFKENFPRLFRGGRAELVLLESEDVLEAGVDITAMPPGKRLQNVGLLSGGEKTMTAIALLISLFQVHASPFFLLDEVDAALDDANVSRFNEIVREMARDSQFLMITHNKHTIELADVLYGVTMENKGVSKLVSVELT